MGILPCELPSALLDRPCAIAGFSIENTLTETNTFGTIEILAIIPGREINGEAVRRALLAPPTPETKAWIETIKANRASQ